MLIRKVFVVLITSFMLIALTNCCTTKNDLKEGNMQNLNKQIQRPPSPGSAEIKCIVENIFEKSNRSYCKIKVSSVLNYGSGTSPIGSGSTMDLQFKNEIKSQLDMIMSDQEEATLLISEVPGGMGMENSTSYRLIKIIK